MKIEIKVPAMGESISEATIGAFLKPNGAFVKVDDELLELETDKVNQVLYAQQAGTVSWSINGGDTVKIGQVLGTIDGSKEAPANDKDAPTEDKAKEVSKNSDKSKAEASKSSSKTQTNEETGKPVLEKVVASRSSIQKNQSTSTSSQTGARSTKDLFLAELNQEQPTKFNPPQSSPSEASSASSKTFQSVVVPDSTERETRKKMSKLRKIIATRLVDVLQETAMLTTFNEVDMTKITGMREAYKEAFLKQYQSRLGFMPFFVKAVVSAMKAYPQINAYIDGDELVYRNYFDIGIAVGTDKGLFVPVVRNCDTLTFAGIERSIESYAAKAREGGLLPGDLQGGGFTITNGGTYGSLLSTPIINPPQCAILGMHKIMKRPVVVDDQIVIRQMMYLALSYDHRVVDGKEAVSFLVHIKNALEDPSRLLIGL